MACIRTECTGRKGSPAAPAQPAREVRFCLGFPRGAGAGLLCLNRGMIAVKPSGQRFFAEQGAMPGESPLRPSGGRGGTKARKFASARRLPAAGAACHAGEIRVPWQRVRFCLGFSRGQKSARHAWTARRQSCPFPKGRLCPMGPGANGKIFPKNGHKPFPGQAGDMIREG